jgi:AbrB family looped-hinge helix DNA binding protein
MSKQPTVTWSKLDPQGRVVIPADIRSELGLEPGKSVGFLIEDGVVQLMTVSQGVRRAQAIAARYVKRQPGKSIVDEFIAERRAEAARE